MRKPSKTLNAGYDVKSPDPGTHDSMLCDTCGEKMDVERNCYGARSRAAAMAGIKERYDMFTCPNAGQMWHNQIIKLLKAARETPSAAIEAILQQEIQQVRSSRTATKEVFSAW